MKLNSRVALGLAASVALTIALSFQPAAGRYPAATAAQVIDRTLRCSLPVWAGVRDITVFTQAGVRESPSKWKSLAGATISTRGSQVSLFQAAAGAPVPTEFKGLAVFDTTLLIGQACRAATARVPFSARGLDGGAADPFGDTYKCSVPRTVLVHVRATFRSSAFLRRDPRSGARINADPRQDVVYRDQNAVRKAGRVHHRPRVRKGAALHVWQLPLMGEPLRVSSRVEDRN